MTKIDVFSGFLGAGKTTLIKKLIAEAFAGQKLVLIENEFGEIGIDGGFLKEAGIQITEMNSGCICCSLVGDFRTALEKVVETYHPDRILIEPSGVGKLSDVTRAVQAVAEHLDVELNAFVTVADVNKVKLYMKNFGEFYNDQIEHAGTILLSRTGKADPAKVEAAVAMLREKNPGATIVTTDWDQLTGAQILEAMEGRPSLTQQLLAQVEQEEHDHHEHHHDHEEHEHHHEHGEGCGCGCHDHEHHHDHDHCGCGHDHEEHEHHHEHGESCGCGCHDHDHHHHHHADEVFTSWSKETPARFTKAQLEFDLQALDSGEFGAVLRAKGILPGEDGVWYHFDYVPGEWQVRTGAADVTGRLCVIGSKLDEAGLTRLFGV